MPRIIDYPAVLERLTKQGLRCNYFNGGSFGFAGATNPVIRGFLGPEDPTIRAEMRGMTRRVEPPYERNLADAAARVWRGHLPGPVWVMPASHWSFELSHGNQHWLPGLLQTIGVDSKGLAGRTNAAAIEFQAGEDAGFGELVACLLENLTASDFTLAFPGHEVVCMIHHHKQLWWVTTDDRLAAALDSLAL
jgi:hypothetical protein